MKKIFGTMVLAALIAACIGCNAKIPDYLVVEGTTVVGFTDEIPENLVIPNGITEIGENA